jgi:hypothetical protein
LPGEAEEKYERKAVVVAEIQNVHLRIQDWNAASEPFCSVYLRFGLALKVNGVCFPKLINNSVFVK